LLSTKRSLRDGIGETKTIQDSRARRLSWLLYPGRLGKGKLRHEDTTNANAAGAGKSNAAGRVDLGLCRALSFVLLALS
jgi:hypothetical protein